MTTTGGPEQSLADPALVNTSTTDSIRVERVADGDDIVVEPDSPLAQPDRSRRLIVGGIVAVLLVAAVVAAVASRGTTHHSSSNVRSLAPVHPPAARPPAAPVVKPATEPNAGNKTPAQPKTNVKSTTVLAAAPPVSIATPPTAAVTAPPPPATVAPVTTPPVATPPVEPPSVLRWTATPASLTVKGGGQASVTVNVSNPTKGTVTLGTPLACAPLLRGPHGAVIGSAICEQMAQVMSPHSQLTQHFTIYATDTASAGGQPLKAGTYTAAFENLFKIKVNVTAS